MKCSSKTGTIALVSSAVYLVDGQFELIVPILNCRVPLKSLYCVFDYSLFTTLSSFLDLFAMQTNYAIRPDNNLLERKWHEG